MSRHRCSECGGREFTTVVDGAYVHALACGRCGLVQATPRERQRETLAEVLTPYQGDGCDAS